MDVFVIRVREPSGDGAPVEVRGTVRCVRTGVEGVFRDGAELLGFIAANQGASNREA